MRLRSESEKKNLGGKIIGACLQLEGSNWEGGRLLVGWQGAHDTFPRGYYTPPPPHPLSSCVSCVRPWHLSCLARCDHPPLPSSPFKYLLQLAAHAHGYMMLISNPSTATSVKQIYIDGAHVSCRRQTARGGVGLGKVT